MIWMSNELHVGRARNGRGVFSTRGFNGGETIDTLKGRPLNGGPTFPINICNEANLYQVGIRAYLDPEGTYFRWINHSCKPNAMVRAARGSLKLLALRDIRAGEEVAFDYSTDMADDPWEMLCNCGAPNCRKVIKEFRFLPPALQEEYSGLGLVPEFVLQLAMAYNKPFSEATYAKSA
jgi:hypothetical protein